MKVNAEDLAYGQWPDILMDAGLDPSYFSGKGGPCPLCGGKDRYRWVQRKHGGVWVCNGCSDDKYATGMHLLMQIRGYKSYAEACDHVRRYFNGTAESAPRMPVHRTVPEDGWTPEKIQANRERMLRFWNEGRAVQEGDPVWRYMLARVPGLDFVPSNIRTHPALEYFAPPVSNGGRPVSLGKYPAMLAYAQDAKGELVQLHKTFLTPDGEKANVPLAKKTDYGVGVNSYAVRMMEPLSDTLGLSEGLETGWASAMLRDIPVWSCLSGPVLAKFELPEELRGRVRKLLIFADSDELKRTGSNRDGSAKLRRPGSAYAEQCAIRARSQGLRTLIIRPIKTGDDFADYWKCRHAEPEAA